MSEPDVSNLLSVLQAIRIIDAVSVQPRVIRLPLGAADGLRLATDLTSDRDYPPFRKSQMDGFAVRSDDVSRTPADLKVVGEIPAGKTPDRDVGPGEAMAIMTGAPLPAGATGVVPVEDTERIDRETVRILRADAPARFVAPIGSDCPAGQVVLRDGTTIGPAQIAVAATVGAVELDVFAAPRVAVLATGDELVGAGQQPGPSQIRNSNNPMLVSVLRRLGCEVIDLGAVRDDPDLIRDALRRGLEHDALFVTGGMSMGEYDYVPRLLIELGVELKITKLRIKPGKPFVFGVTEDPVSPRPEGERFSSHQQANRSPSDRRETGRPDAPLPHAGQPRFVFGLPGNPVSAFVCTVRLASRLLARMAGGRIEERWLTGRLDTGMSANGPREFYHPAVRAVAPGRDSSHAEFATITPLKWKGSADLFTLARANVLLVRPENDPTIPKGTIIRVLEI
jgi:molybdopterin molybdotransferase